MLSITFHRDGGVTWATLNRGLNVFLREKFVARWRFGPVQLRRGVSQAIQLFDSVAFWTCPPSSTCFPEGAGESAKDPRRFVREGPRATDLP